MLEQDARIGFAVDDLPHSHRSIPYTYQEQLLSLEELCATKINQSLRKRLFDFFFSFLFLLCIGSWLFVLIAVLIKLESKGPIFFRQSRRGRNGKLFTCLKFRSMFSNSRDVDSRGNYLQATKGDTRITRVGMIMRKYSIDELPQFLNVFWGDMSVVGPRPHPEPLNLQCQRELSYYWKRHLVKPGITGLAQAKGYRGETKSNFSMMEKRVLYDLIYIRRWTPILDLKIVLATIFKYPLGI